MSLFTTISGIANNQSMLDVIGDNIANINTTGFKSSKITFETIFSNTISSGGVPTEKSGGINPKQVGLGVTISEISKNFSRGSVQTTGRNTDLNIQGEGFFTLKDADGKMLLTRAGNFSVDSDGNLVNPKGLKVIGTSNVTSSASGTNTVQIPTSLVLNETNTISSGNTNLTPGAFTISVNGGAAKTIGVTNTDTIQDVINKINSNLSGSTAALNSSNKIVITGTDTVAFADGTSNFATLAAPVSSYKSVALPAIPSAGDFTIDIDGGGPQTVTILGTDTYADVANSIQAVLPAGSTATYDAITNKMQITGPNTMVIADGTSTFASDSNLALDSYITSTFSDTPKVDIGIGDPTSSNNFKATARTIGSDGSIEATYSNGARITVTGDPIRTLKYTSSSSKEISGSNVTQSSGTAVDPAQLQIQLAQVINPNGLQSVGGNMFAVSSVAGTPSFAVGRSGGLGSIDAGSLEASNVDLPTEFANMILAQKAVEANSRAFSIQNQIMDTIVNLGR